MRGRALAVLLVVFAAVPGVAFAADKIPLVGVLWHAGNAEEEAAFRGPLREGFEKLGYAEGKTVIFDECYAAEEPERFKSCATQLVAHNVDVLIAGSVPAALAAQLATSTIPIVLVANPDPVGLKLVASLSHPGGNITGLSTIAFDLAAKRVQILKEAMPGLTRLALLVNPNTAGDAPRLVAEMKPALDQLGLAAEAVEAHQPGDIDIAFARVAAGGPAAVIVSQNALFFNERQRIAELGLKHRLPTLVPADVFVEAGALLSYGPSWPPIFRNAAIFVDKILKGAKPADLPVEQPTVFDLTINRRTAEALGIELPLTLVARANRVIE
jgi:putative ABC transport system substrate-binding protein